MSSISPRKPIIAILGSFPLGNVNPDFRQKGWYTTTWLYAMYEAFCLTEQYEIHWVTFSKSTRWRKVFRSANQYFHVLPCFTLKYAQKTHYLHARWQMKRELQHINPDVVHAWGTENYYAAAGTVFKGRKILSMQGILSACVKRSPMPDFMKWQAAKEEEWIKQYDLVTTESSWGVDCCRAITTETPVVRWEYAARKAFFQAERALTNRPVCLFGGTDTAVKNVDTAIAAFSDARLAHIKLLLAGVSSERHPNLPSNILALGGLTAEELIGRLKQTWCLVHPSLADTSPNMIKEARVMGIPVITSTECGGKQYVEEGKSGYVLHPMDKEGLIQAVLSVTKDKGTALTMGQYGREACRKALTEKTMMDGLHAIYERLLSE